MWSLEKKLRIALGAALFIAIAFSLWQYWILVIICLYIAGMIFLVLFFMSVSRWDREIKSMGNKLCDKKPNKP